MQHVEGQSRLTEDDIQDVLARVRVASKDPSVARRILTEVFDGVLQSNTELQLHAAKMETVACMTTHAALFNAKGNKTYIATELLEVTRPRWTVNWDSYINKLREREIK